MTKSELVKKLLEKHDNLYLKDIRLLVDAILEEMSTALQQEDRIELRGFGAFSIRRRKPRVARNPKTNEKVELGERSVVYFRAGKGLRDRINSNGTVGESFSNAAPAYEDRFGSEGGSQSGEDDSDGGSTPPFSSPSY